MFRQCVRAYVSLVLTMNKEQHRYCKRVERDSTDYKKITFYAKFTTSLRVVPVSVYLSFLCFTSRSSLTASCKFQSLRDLKSRVDKEYNCFNGFGKGIIK